jgi:hypothetical protein
MLIYLILFNVVFGAGTEFVIWRIKKDREMLGYPVGKKEFGTIDKLLQAGRWLNLTSVILAILKFLFW